MSPTVYYILHVTAAFLLVGYTFQAFAAPDPERRGGLMAKTGILSVIVLVAGVGLAHKNGHGFPLWVILKLGCWLGISALSGMVFRKPEKAGSLALGTILFILAAVLLVYIKPFV